MELSTDEITDISESEKEEYEEEVYANLKDAGPRRIKYPNGSFRCPFCPGKKKLEYIYSDLLQHAVACGFSCPRSPRDRASHLALARLLRSDYRPSGPDFPPHPPPEDVPFSSETDTPTAAEDRFVVPWFGVLANLLTWIDPATGRWLGESGGAIKEKLALNGLHPLRVCPVYAGRDVCRSHSGYALVEFASGWDGFAEAIAFERYFEKFGRGKSDWIQNGNVRPKGTLYGWVAREDDYFGDGASGEQLRNSGDLRTLTEVAKSESRKNCLLVKDLIDQIVARDMLLEEIGVTGDWKAVLLKMMKECDVLRDSLGKGYEGRFGLKSQFKFLEDLKGLDKFGMLSLSNDEFQLQKEPEAGMNHILEMEPLDRVDSMQNADGEDASELSEDAFELNNKHSKLTGTITCSSSNCN